MLSFEFIILKIIDTIMISLYLFVGLCINECRVKAAAGIGAAPIFAILLFNAKYSSMKRNINWLLFVSVLFINKIKIYKSN